VMSSHEQLRAKVNEALKRPALGSLSADPNVRIEKGVSSGSMKLNMALSGNPLIGFVWGRIAEVYGPEQCLDASTFIHYSVRSPDGKIQNNKGGDIQRLYERFHGIRRFGKGFYQRGSSIGSDFYVPSIDSSGVIFQNKVADVVFSGRKDCVSIRSVSGHEIVSTLDHRFWTGREYIRAGDLATGDIVYVHGLSRVRGVVPQVRYSDILVKYHSKARTKIVTANDRDGRKKYAYVLYRVRRSHAVFEAMKNSMTLEGYVALLNTGDRTTIDGLWTVPSGMIIHHTDEDKLNDSLDNLELMSSSDHRKFHAHRNIRSLSFVATPDTIESIVPVGYRETYDIKCYAPNNNFVANGFVVHNSGKTTLTLHVIHEAQKQEAETGVPLPCLFIDAEHALDTRYAEAIGVDLDNLSISQPDCGEDALNEVESAVKNGYKVIIVDSVAALVPQAELEGEMGAAHVGLQARLMSQALRKLTGITQKSGALIIFINQIRMKIGVMFGNPETTSGGNALKFYATYRLDVRAPRGGKKEGKSLMGYGVEASGVEIGNAVNVSVVKNKVFPPHRKASFNVEYGVGIDKVADAIDFLVFAGAFKPSGKTKSDSLYLPSLDKSYTPSGLAKVLSDPVAMADVINIVKAMREYV